MHFGFPERFRHAIVNRIPFRTPAWRVEKTFSGAGQSQRPQRKYEGRAEKNDDKKIGIRRHDSYRWRKPSVCSCETLPRKPRVINTASLNGKRSGCLTLRKIISPSLAIFCQATRAV